MDRDQAQALRARLSALQKHRLTDPGNLPLACDTVDLCLQLGENAEAARILDEALILHPGDSALLFRRSSLALAMQDYPAAETILATLMAMGQDSFGIRCNRAQALLWLHRAAEGAELLRTLLPRAHEYPPLLLLSSRCDFQLQDFTAAAADARAYLAIRPDDPEGEGLLALILLDGGEAAEAEIHAQAALVRDPQQLEALLVQARLALGRLDSARATKSMEAALKRYPTSGAAWSALAQAELLRIDVTAAEKALEQALRYMPDHIGTWHLKAWCQIMRGDAPGAKESFARAYDLDRNFGETHGGLAVVAAMQGDEAEARSALKRALRLNADGFAARYAECLLLERAGRPDEARAVVEEVLNRDSSHKGSSYLALIAAHRARLGKH